MNGCDNSLPTNTNVCIEKEKLIIESTQIKFSSMNLKLLLCMRDAQKCLVLEALSQAFQMNQVKSTNLGCITRKVDGMGFTILSFRAARVVTEVKTIDVTHLETLGFQISLVLLGYWGCKWHSS